MKKWSRVIAALLLPLLLGGCGGEESPPKVDAAPTTYLAPEITPAQFHGAPAMAHGEVKIDTSAVAEGYVAVSARSERRLKFQVCFGETTYNYDLKNDGTPEIFTLQSGNGSYEFRVMENISKTSYVELDSSTLTVALHDEFQPFLHQSQFASFDEDTACAKKARELVADATNSVDAVERIFSYICENITYDKQKAQQIAKGYVPEPDEILASGMGICFDYASVAACMLRSQGIPTKIIFGYVSPGELYHAWNMVYTEETGWIAVNYQLIGGEWSRIDCTFSAGSDAEFTGDGTNYADLYVY